MYFQPSSGLTCTEINNSNEFDGQLKVYDVLGKEIETIHTGKFIGNSRKYFLDVTDYSSGAYQIVLVTEDSVRSAGLMVK